MSLSHYNIVVPRRALIIAFLLLATLAVAESKRLILKNGDYQAVQKYEVKGDRVRYFSAERNGWEEIPTDMVDWEATHKWEADLAKAEEPVVEHIPTKEELAKQADEDMSPEVAPSLRLPKTGGVFAVDTYASKQRLVELTQNTGNVNEHIGRNLLLKKVNPLSSRTQTVELPGHTSQAQVHVAKPTIYINVDQDPDDPNAAVARKRYQSRPSSDAYRFQFVKLDQKGSTRILGSVKTNLAEEVTKNQNIIPTYGRIMDGDVWIKIEPKDDLPPGEYAVAEMLPGDDINRYVWDFSYYPENSKQSDTAKQQAQKEAEKEAKKSKKK